MVSGEGGRQRQLVGCQGMPVLKCCRRGKDLRAELGRGKRGPLTEDTLSEMTELNSYVVLSIRVPRGELICPKSSNECA